jgi:hypothetical protein
MTKIYNVVVFKKAGRYLLRRLSPISREQFKIRVVTSTDNSDKSVNIYCGDFEKCSYSRWNTSVFFISVTVEEKFIVYSQ